MRRLPLVWRLALCSGVAAAGSVITVLAGAYVLACRRVADLGKEGALGPYYGDSGLYVPVGPAGVLDKVAALQAELGWPFIVVALGGLLLAAVLGYIAARTALRPVATLTAVAERVAATRDLGTRIEVDRDDELGSLARSFNTMLDALERSAKAQRRLVADASHELRTPLAALRTNVELLRRADRLDPAERAELLRDTLEGLEELSALVSDVVELARDEEPSVLFEDVRLDEIVERVTARARAYYPRVRFTVHLEPAVVYGVPDRLTRAVANLLDNAGKYSPEGGVVEVRLRGGELTVRDHGPGIAEEDLPYVFDRFYRAPSARSMPGSGLGLAIVRQVVEGHGGTVEAANAPGGGTVVRMRLPVTRPYAPGRPRSRRPVNA
ncbi:MAG: HAMP domain-containing sensor histidine kinase [Actinomycetes bacterium]|jgi:two-component system sensor histidine kinase MprB